MPDNANENETAVEAENEEAPSYVVVAAGAQINTVDGIGTLVTRGGPVPSNVDPDHLRYLLDSGLVAEADPVGGLEATLTGDHTAVVTAPLEDVAGGRLTDLPIAGAQVGAGPPTDDDADDAGDGDVARPNRNAPKSDWAAYAATQGETDPELTKDELVEKYGRA